MGMAPTPQQFQKMGELLVKHGFILPQDTYGNNIRGKYTFDPASKTFKPKEGDTIDPEHALMEYAEDTDINNPHQEGPTEYIATGYPEPVKRYHLLYEHFNLSIEEVYFWLIDHIKYDQGWTRSYKIRDIFTATENSAFFGASQQRLGIQQDRVQQYLATIGKMVKDLFQLVRELRIIDEKMLPRNDWKTSKSADATLKGEYIDLVENRGGQTSPSSVYGLASQIGYAALPDLFFNTRVYDIKKVDAFVDKLDFNKNIKNVLKRKLYQFINWKLKTDHELETRRTFTLKYLRQHWDVIEMYMNWIKPYLRHIARLQMNDDRLDTMDLIGAFEQSYIETEILFSKPKPKKGKVRDVFLLTINYRTRPHMNFVQEGYQKGPTHVGVADMFIRGYEWTDEHIDFYIRYRQQEDLYMLGVVDKSVQAAMEALGDELEKYLAEAGEPKFKDKVEKERKAAEEHLRARTSANGMFTGILEPFSALFSGFGDMFDFNLAKPKKKSKAGWSGNFPPTWGEAKKDKNFMFSMYQTQKNFKKNHGFLSWG